MISLEDAVWCDFRLILHDFYLEEKGVPLFATTNEIRNRVPILQRGEPLTITIVQEPIIRAVPYGDLLYLYELEVGNRTETLIGEWSIDQLISDLDNIDNSIRDPLSNLA
jgi:hypothetical protein